MSAPEVQDRYERLRRRVVEGLPGGADALVILRRQGLQAWSAHVGSPPPVRPARTDASPRLDPASRSHARSPLVCLCTDMLLATLASQEIR